MKERIASITNILYVIAGVLGYVAYPELEGGMFATTFILLGLGSFWYHATKSRAGQAADEIAMYAAFGTLLWIGLVAAVELPGVPLWGPSILLVVAFASHRVANTFVVMPTLVVGIVACIWLHAGWRGSMIVLMLFTAAVLVRSWSEWHEDNGDVLTADIGHGMWHLLTSAAPLLAFYLLLP